MFAASKSGSAADPTDPQFNYVTMLLHGDGTNGAQNNTFVDSSTNNFTITRNGNTTQGTFTPYGSNWSTYINGLVPGAYLVAASSSATAFGTGNFTIEMWVNSGAQSNTRLAGNGNGASWSSGKWVMATATPGNPNKFIFACNNYNSGADMLVSTTVANDNAWHHIAVVRNSNTWILYVDGVSQSTVTSSVSLDNGTANPIAIGYSMISGDTGYSGYVSNFRMSSTAVYTANFTPSTTNLTAISGTQLLTCQNNRWVDNSTNALAITVGSGGNYPSVQRFSPFSPTTAYSTNVIGGSGYFDGTGDYLSASSNAAYQFGSGNFTIECWAYMTGAAQQFFFAQWNSPNRSWGLLVRNSGTTLSFVYSTTGSNETSIDGTIVAQANRWAHFAAVRNGNTLTTYMNGVSVASASMTGVTLYSATQAVEIGRNPEATTTWNFTGYTTDVRIVKGTAVYTTAFTPPTAPLTAITNTSLLLSYTNAAIIDNAMMNNLETLGNAQISTSVKKYGTGSISFDGSGDYLTTYDPSYKLSVGSGDFTFECWVYVNSLPATITALYHLKNDDALATTVFILELTPSGAISLSTGAALIASGTNGKITTGSWIHFAFVRTSGVFKTFFNGVQDISTANTTTYNGTYLQIGAWRYSGYDFSLNGYIDDLRISKVARYTANFTAPTAAFADKG